MRAPVQYGQGVLARFRYLHLYQLLPVNRTSETMRDLFGCHLSAATVQRTARLSSEKLLQAELRIKASLRESSIIGAYETGLRVSNSGGYIHVARTEELTRLSLRRAQSRESQDTAGGQVDTESPD